MGTWTFPFDSEHFQKNTESKAKVLSLRKIFRKPEAEVL
jgi:hypothetical protein